MTINFDITLNKSQRDLLGLVEGDSRFIIANLSRQQGKSVLMKVLCTQWLFQSNKEIGYITPTLKLSKKFFNDLTSVIPSELLVKSNASDLILQSITGSTLYFYSAEQSNRIRGNTFDYLVLDEAAFMKEGDKANHIWYSVLSPTIKVKGKKIIMVSTPNGKQNFFYDLASIAQSGQAGYSYIMRTIYDDSMCNNIEEIKSQTPDIMFRQEYMCEFLDDARSFFTGYHQCYDDQMVFDWTQPLWCGIDWSSTGKDNTILSIVNQSGQIVQMKIEGQLDQKYDQIASILNSYPTIKSIYAESNSIGSVMTNELQKRVKKKITLFTTTNESKTDIIGEMAVLLERGDLTYSDLDLDRELGAFGYSITRTQKLAFEGLGEKDDRVMSLAIALKARKDNKGYNKSNFTFI